MHPISFKIIKFSSIDSTNNYAKSIVKNTSIQHGTVVVADYQTAGRGQHQNNWQSTAGKNVLMSIILKMEVPIQQLFYINIISSLAVYNCINACIINTHLLHIKWANDIIYNNKKIGGILIENNIVRNQINSVIIGIGLNINEQFKTENSQAISLTDIMGIEFDINLMIQKILDYFNMYYAMYKNNKTNLLAMYNNVLYKKNNQIYYLQNNQKIPAILLEVNENGHLKIALEKEIILINNSTLVWQYNF